MNPWKWHRDKATRVLADTPDGTEFVVSAGEKFMIMGRQGYAVYVSKRILQVLEAAIAKIAEGKEHYKPVLEKIRTMLTSFDELLDLIDKADKINKLKEGVTEGQG